MKTDAISAPLLTNVRLPNDDTKNIERNSQTDDTNEDGKATKASSLGFRQQVQSVSESRKSALLMRMGQLKEQLEALLKLTIEMNPRLIKQLARELKALVAEYGRLSGPQAKMPNFSMGVAATDPAGGQQMAAATSDASTVAEAAALAAEAERASPAADAEVEQAEAAANAAVSGDKTDEEADAATGTASADDSDEKDGIGGINTEQSSSNNAADKAFFTEAKKLSRMIKMLMARVKKASNKEEEKENKETRKAIKELDETINKTEVGVFNQQAVGTDFTYQINGIAVAEGVESTSAFIAGYV